MSLLNMVGNKAAMSGMKSQGQGVISFSFDRSGIDNALREYDRGIDNATKAALRAAGRKLTQAEKRGVPVYQGDDQRAPRGRLKNSIKQSKRIKTHGPHNFSISVGPKGGLVHLYRGKIEAKTGFAARAHVEAHPIMMEAANAAYARYLQRLQAK